MKDEELILRGRFFSLHPSSFILHPWLDAVIFLLVAVWILYGLGSYGLYEPHEAQYAGAASEMLLRGDWVTSYLNGAPELNKPPLFYWLIAVSFKVLGHSGMPPEFVARLPLALIALGGVLLAWQWARELWGPRAGRCAALMLAVAPGWYIFSHQLLIDELLSVLILAALYLLWKAICARDSLWRWALFYGVVGLAVLAKGLPGLFFPLLALGLFVIVRRDWGLIRRSQPLLGIVLVAGVVGPWAYLFEAHNPGALRYMIVNEHLRRIFDERIPKDYGGVQVSAIKFVLFTVLWCAPWSFLLPQIASFSLKGARTDASGSGPRSAKDAVLLLGIGAVAPVAFFALIPARLIYYGLPAVPPLAVLCAGSVSAAGYWSERSRRVAAGFAVMFGLALACVRHFLPEWLASLPDLAATPMLLKNISSEGLLLATGFVLCGLLLFCRRGTLAFTAIVVLMGATELHSVGQFNALDSFFSSKRLVEWLAPAAGDDCVWVSEGSSEVGASAGLSFYLRQGSPNSPGYVLIMSDDERRPPPSYPGAPPKYLINHGELEQLWASGRPVLFVTDFQRADWKLDPPRLPSRDCRLVQVAHSIAGHRQVYANSCARKRLAAGGLVLSGTVLEPSSDMSQGGAP